ncbi:hypothetical protein AVEN_270506-1 [Araneus ventricosus]|uniref:Uncharacterized protein n=1 Tax=Araneus ventricosus TaxID=182803 RepID=A0A4Y2B7B4_ARAVE|nr:hypothetical protein AVEN_270506-1 [Araneus ventricosus]
MLKSRENCCSVVRSLDIQQSGISNRSNFDCRAINAEMRPVRYVREGGGSLAQEKIGEDLISRFEGFPAKKWNGFEWHDTICAEEWNTRY